MKIFAIIVNSIWLGVVIWSFAINDKETKQATDIWIFVAVIATLILNIVAFFAGSGLDNWVSLFLRRKALEEKKKIEALNSKDDTHHAA
jgi:hypothetical protein